MFVCLVDRLATVDGDNTTVDKENTNLGTTLTLTPHVVFKSIERIKFRGSVSIPAVKN